MKHIKEEFVRDEWLKLMDEIRSLINESKIGTRIGCGLLMRIIYEEYREHTSQDVYNNFLDNCKEYWIKNDRMH